MSQGEAVVLVASQGGQPEVLYQLCEQGIRAATVWEQ
jgi:hypothetical protein